MADLDDAVEDRPVTVKDYVEACQIMLEFMSWAGLGIVYELRLLKLMTTLPLDLLLALNEGGIIWRQ
jgi:hypothetical protein